jgi:hypothetical protein
MINRTLKVQGTVRGYTAYVVEQLMAAKGQPLSDVTQYIFERWIDDNGDFLKSAFNLTPADFKAAREGKGQVVGFDRQDAQ